MLFEVHTYGDVAVLCCTGRIVKGDGADDLLRAVMSQSSPHLQIDLSRVRIIDAGGLGVLAGLARWARDENRTFEVVNPSKRVREALESTGLASALQTGCLVSGSNEAA